MRIRILLSSPLDMGQLLQVLPEKSGPRKDGDAWRKTGGNLYPRAITWSSYDLQFSRDSDRAFSHPAQTKAAQIAGFYESCTVISNNHVDSISLVLERDRDRGRVRMLHGVGDRFLPDSVKRL